MRVYGVQLSYNNEEEKIHLPINPESIEVGEAGKGKVYDIASIGEINVIKDRSLTEYSFKSLFPARWYPFVTVDSPLLPMQYIKMIEKWMTTKRPIRFIFTSDTYDINTAASIESFQWKEVAGSGGDIEYTLSLKKYVFYGARRLTIVSSTEVAPDQEEEVVVAPEPPERPNDREEPTTYTLVSGDNLWKVAKAQLGDGDRWKEIQTLNDISDAELKALPTGKVLKLS